MYVEALYDIEGPLDFKLDLQVTQIHDVWTPGI
jgi:hypothetical protein